MQSDGEASYKENVDRPKRWTIQPTTTQGTQIQYRIGTFERQEGERGEREWERPIEASYRFIFCSVST